MIVLTIQYINNFHVQEFLTGIEIQSQFHFFVTTEMTERLSVERLYELRDQLQGSKDIEIVNQHFDDARDFGVSSERMNKLVKEIDRVTADKANIIEELDIQLMALQQKSTRSLIHSERMCMSEISTQASRVGRKASSRVGSSDGRDYRK